ncbi:hypothetical protein M8J76_015319 [Diaphorina citri]|nr:hypothetical protein M8J75_012291 [Diaphorina citri]KAI5741607.1 hypothetical protein M8J76_015319 [Diaphorina citri]
MAENKTNDIPKYKVIILGAGMAGLSAASHLMKNKHTDFLVLEARDRIGGRIAVYNSDDVKLEMGANWIHGVLGNPMYEVAMANGLIDIVSVPKQHTVIATTEDGHQVPHPILQEIYEAYICFLHRCEEYFLSQYLPPEDIHSVGEHINLEIELYLRNIVSPEERYLRHLIFQCLLKRETCITGCNSMADIDLLELGSYTELQGGNISLPTGYSSILEPISRNIPHDKVLLNHRITSVRWKYKPCIPEENEEQQDSDDSDKTVIDVCDREPSEDSTDHIVIKCDNGSVFHARSVICTLPLGVLQAESHLFCISDVTMVVCFMRVVLYVLYPWAYYRQNLISSVFQM